MKKMFKFINLNMHDDKLDDKGKVLDFREINCIAESEEIARCKVSLPKSNTIKGKLDNNWTLFSIIPLNKDW